MKPEEDGGLAVTGLDAPAIGDLAAKHGIAVHALIPRSPSLEEAYLDLTGESRLTSGRPRHDRPRPAGPSGARDVLTSEWTKLRSVRSTYWTLLVAVATPIGISALVAVVLSHAPGKQTPVDPLLPGLISQEYAVLAVGVLGVLAFSTEYGTGLIRTTFAAVPRRRAVLAAKAAVIGALTLVAGEVVAFASFALVQAVLSGKHLGVSLSHPGVLGAVLAGGLLLFVVATMGVGLGSIVRHTAGGIAALVGLIFLPPSSACCLPRGVPASPGSPCSTPPGRSPRCTRPRTCSRGREPAGPAGLARPHPPSRRPPDHPP